MGYKIIWRVLPSLKYFHWPKGFGLAKRKPQRLRIRRGWMWCLGWWNQKGLGAFSFGCRIELVSRNLPSYLGKCALLRWRQWPEHPQDEFWFWWRYWKASCWIWWYQSLGCWEKFHDFYHFFVSDLIFSFRINCSISLCNFQWPLAFYSWNRRQFRFPITLSSSQLWTSYYCFL